MSFLFETKFNTGRVVITPGSSDLLAENEQNPLEFIERHTNLDRGNLSEEDYQANLYAVGKDLRIFSSFNTEDGKEIWVITEHDRSVTTILLPEEY